MLPFCFKLHNERDVYLDLITTPSLILRRVLPREVPGKELRDLTIRVHLAFYS